MKHFKTPLEMHEGKKKRLIPVIGTANGDLTIEQYVKAWKIALSAPDGATFSKGLTGWWSVSKKEVLEQFSFGVNDRINRHDPKYGKGRKWSYEWQTETLRAARDLNQPRLVINWLPEWLKARFSYRLRENVFAGEYA